MHHVLIRLKTKEKAEGINVCPASALEGPALLDFWTGLHFVCVKTLVPDASYWPSFVC